MSGPLVPLARGGGGGGGGGGDSSFSHQGSVDYTALLNSTVNWTVGVLGRMSLAGVDPYTLAVGQGLCLSSFELQKYGQENVTSAVKNLPCIKGRGNSLWFGFGIKSIVRTMAETHEGLKMLALCGALSEIVSEDYRATVIFEMVKATNENAPISAMPSHLQWSSLIKACDGVFSSTLFTTTVQQFAHLLTGVSSDPAENKGRWFSTSSEESLAKCLLAIGKVSAGKLSSVTVAGESLYSISWLAAFSEWVLGLNISLSSHRYDISMNPVYVSNRQGSTSGEVHVQFLFIDEEQNTTTKPQLQIQKTWYRLELSNRYSLKTWFRPEGDTVLFRIPWESTDLGMKIYSILSSEEELELFCHVVGRSACLLEAHRMGLLKDLESQLHKYGRPPIFSENGCFTSQDFTDEESIQVGPLTAHIAMQEGVGIALIESIVRAFPRLRSVNWKIQERYQDINLKAIKWEDVFPQFGTSGSSTSELASGGKIPSNAYSVVCKVALDAVFVGRTLSMVNNGHQINPTSIVNTHFWRSFQELSHYQHNPLLYFAGVLLYRIIQMEPFISAMYLFCEEGRRWDPESTTAASSSGVCIFYDLFNGGSSPVQGLLKPSVLTGCIEVEGRQFAEIRDGSLKGENNPLYNLSLEQICSLGKDGLHFKDIPTLVLNLSVRHAEASLDYTRTGDSYISKEPRRMGVWEGLKSASIPLLNDMLQSMPFYSCQLSSGCLHATRPFLDRPKSSCRKDETYKQEVIKTEAVRPFDPPEEEEEKEEGEEGEEGEEKEEDATGRSEEITIFRIRIPLPDLPPLLKILTYSEWKRALTFSEGRVIWTEGICDVCLVDQIKAAVEDIEVSRYYTDLKFLVLHTVSTLDVGR